MEKRCDTCVYWQFDQEINHPRDPSHHVKIGYCKIGPPELDLVTGRGRWPLTLADEGCHGHQPMETLAEALNGER